MTPIYLDYAATTPVDPRVALKMHTCLMQAGVFGNAASLHAYGLRAKDLIEDARAQVAALLGASANEIIFTSGATESNNLALKGAAALYQRRGKHIVTMKTEHKSVLDVCQHLEKEGYQVTYLAPEDNGLLNIEKFEAALREDTVLASIMHVNNETGVIQDIAKIASITSARGIIFHVDAAQSVGKLPINLEYVPVDLMSVCAHKVYGPKGVGALYLRKKPRRRVAPLIHGGGHEQGMRSGTLATHQIVGLGEAFHLARSEMLHDVNHATQLRAHFLQGLKGKQVKMTCDTENTVPHILNMQFTGMLAKALLDEWSHIAASTASACQGSGIEGSHVLRAMGLNNREVDSAIRFSFGRFTTEDEVKRVWGQVSSYGITFAQ